MNENRLSPDGETASPLQSYQGNSSLLRRGMDRLAVLRAATGTLAATESESRLLWKFAAYGSNIQGRGAKPSLVVSPIAESLPSELKSRRQWMCWDGDIAYWTPVGPVWYAYSPISPISGGTGYADDPLTWGTFSQAITFSLSQGLAGVGLVLPGEAPCYWTKCLRYHDPHTGGEWYEMMEILVPLDLHVAADPNESDTFIIKSGFPPGFHLSGAADGKYWYSTDFEDHPTFLRLADLLTYRSPDELGRETDGRDHGAGTRQISWIEAEGGEYGPYAFISYCRIAGDRAIVRTSDEVNVSLDIKTGVQISENVEPPEDQFCETGGEGFLDEARGILVEWESWNGDCGPSVWAINASTRKQLWQLSFEDIDIDFVDTTIDVLVEDGIAYVRTTIGDDLFALDEQTGEELWYFDWSKVRSFELISSSVLVYSSDAIYAADKMSGEITWQYEIEVRDGWKKMQVINGPDMYVADRRGFLHAIDLATGVCRWCRSIPHYADEITALTGKLIILRSRGWVSAIERETGELRWELGGDAPLEYTPSNSDVYVREFVVSGDIIFAVVSHRYVVAVEIETGKERWRFDVGEEVSLLEVTDEAVFVMGAHVLYALRKT